jgi:pyruvate/2-oxoglutarate dehydrogenase complex dihydrolipoamide acyltransferase (E2) component
MTWIRFIPSFLLRTFIRIADRNITMAKHYGKICVTAVGMYNKDSAWFIPHGTATILLTVGGINDKVILVEDKPVNREYLCLTISFDHDIVDGAPAARFVKELTETIRCGNLLELPGV